MEKFTENQKKLLGWFSGSGVGASSATMASIHLGLDKNLYSGYFDAPYDMADFNRCYELVKRFPEIKNSFDLIKRKCKNFAPFIDNWDDLCECLEYDKKHEDSYSCYEYIEGIRE